MKRLAQPQWATRVFAEKVATLYRLNSFILAMSTVASIVMWAVLEPFSPPIALNLWLVATNLAQLSGFALGFPALAERLRCGSKALLWISGKMPL
jgi:hypothetical protein